MAIRGDGPLKIQQRAGHRTFEMTQKYIRTAEAVGEVIGATFPPLPESLAAGRYRREYRPSGAQLTETIVEAPGIEPGAIRALPLEEIARDLTLRAGSVRRGRSSGVCRASAWWACHG
jgi:hypothetical protein